MLLQRSTGDKSLLRPQELTQTPIQGWNVFTIRKAGPNEFKFRYEFLEKLIPLNDYVHSLDNF